MKREKKSSKQKSIGFFVLRERLPQYQPDPQHVFVIEHDGKRILRSYCCQNLKGEPFEDVYCYSTFLTTKDVDILQKRWDNDILVPAVRAPNWGESLSQQYLDEYQPASDFYGLKESIINADLACRKFSVFGGSHDLPVGRKAAIILSTYGVEYTFRTIAGGIDRLYQTHYARHLEQTPETCPAVMKVICSAVNLYRELNFTAGNDETAKKYYENIQAALTFVPSYQQADDKQADYKDFGNTTQTTSAAIGPVSCIACESSKFFKTENQKDKIILASKIPDWIYMGDYESDGETRLVQKLIDKCCNFQRIWQQAERSRPLEGLGASEGEKGIIKINRSDFSNGPSLNLLEDIANDTERKGVRHDPKRHPKNPKTLNELLRSPKHSIDERVKIKKKGRGSDIFILCENCPKIELK